MRSLFELNAWHLMTGKWDPAKKAQYQQALTLENSMMVVDGSFEETPAKVTLQNIWVPQAAANPCGYTGVQPGFLDLTQMTVLLNGVAVDWEKDQISDFLLDLDLHNGLLTRSFVVTRAKIKVKLQFTRFLSQAMPDLLVERLEMTNLTTQALEAEIHASLAPTGSNDSLQAWEILSIQPQLASIVLITPANSINSMRFMAGAQAHHLTSLRPVANPNLTDQLVENWFRGELLPNQPVTFEKRVVVATSLDFASDQAISERLTNRSSEVDNLTYEELLAANNQAWAQKYQDSDLKIDGNVALQQTLRTANFHFLAAPEVKLPLSWENESVFIPALLEAGLTDQAQALLQQRINQLASMQANAKATGAYGAFLPELTFDGNEQAANADLALFGVHRSFALVYAFAQYNAFSCDFDWLQQDAAPLLAAVASYWHSRVQYAARYQKYVVLGVSGPDAYESNTNNNWLTNYTIKEGISYLLATIPQALDPELQQELKKIAAGLYLPEARISGQHVKLENELFGEKDLNYTVAQLTIFDQPIFQNWSLDHLARQPILQQPDVFWAFYYFPEQFTPAEIDANFDFYQKYLAHDTPQSLGMTALTAALAHRPDEAVNLLIASMNHYVINDRNQGALLRLALTRGLLGLNAKPQGLTINPQIAESIAGYQLKVNYQRRLIKFAVDGSGIEMQLQKGADLEITVFGKKQVITSKTSLHLSWPQKQN